MRSDTTPVIRLKDYRVADYLIDTVDLDVKLAPDATLIVATLAMRPNPAGVAGATLTLDGDELDLLSLLIDGETASGDAFSATPQQLVLHHPPLRPFSLTIETKIDPQANTKLMGLYRSNGIYCTQCEAEGFRRITYFLDRPDVMSVYTVRIEAEMADAPVLLSNGNPLESGTIEATSRHFAIWHDPHPKPAYLFALVGGDLGSISERFVTATGRNVALNIYVEKGKEARAAYAMDALQRSMRWDEQVFGCAYDLDIFNIVAVSDFNMGAMENKGLNVFNDKYVLATAETATDIDYANIEAIIAHEYFHNWTGNRITCRDWFQLCLKEGLTVFRDQEFSSDMRSRAVKRIEDVLDLRERQFSEDAGPLSHAVRPEAYSEINNFYTATIYEKGAELIRMLKHLIGPADFKRGMDLYFLRCDGSAATIEDFIACFAEASGRDLAGFMLWYGQAGTPLVKATRCYDETTRRLDITFEQTTAPTPGQPNKQPLPMPITMAMVGVSAAGSPDETHAQVFVLDSRKATLSLDDVAPRAVPSLLRGFSAPVTLQTDLSDPEMAVLARHDSDPFNRWQAIQTLASRLLIERTDAIREERTLGADAHIGPALRGVIDGAHEDLAFAAFALQMPSVQEVARAIGANIDPQAIYEARESLRRDLGHALADPLQGLIATLHSDEPYSPDAKSAGRRALRTAALGLLAAAKPETAMPVLAKLAASGDNMTARASALGIIARIPGDAREEALSGFAQEFSGNPLVLDKWFAMNATICEPGTLDRVKRLMTHPHYSMTNPNRFRSLIGAFAAANFTEFNRADGEGYRFVGGLILEVDQLNPQVAARLATAFRTWKTLEPARRMQAESALRAIQGIDRISIDLKDIIERSLA